ncbi:MAG: hypothetical protein ACK5Y2_14045 [Bdellovibrionales bacterium]
MLSRFDFPVYIESVVSDGAVNTEALDRLLRDLDNLRCRASLKPNYSLEGLEIQKALGFDVLRRDSGEFIAMSGVLNGGRYPDGIYRVLNRAYFNPKYRTSHFSTSAWASKYILPWQIEKYREKFKLIFVSRERPSGRRFLKYWVQNLAPDRSWLVSNRMVHVAPKGQGQGCFQYIAYKEYSPVTWAFNSISEQEWRLLKP